MMLTALLQATAGERTLLEGPLVRLLPFAWFALAGLLVAVLLPLGAKFLKAKAEDSSASATARMAATATLRTGTLMKAAVADLNATARKELELAAADGKITKAELMAGISKLRNQAIAQGIALLTPKGLEETVIGLGVAGIGGLKEHLGGVVEREVEAGKVATAVKALVPGKAAELANPLPSKP